MNKYQENSSKSLTWLITGGCGFIGTSLISYLLKNSKQTIRVLDNLTVGTKEDLMRVCEYTEISADCLSEGQSSHKVQLIIGDILDDNLLDKVTKNVDVIVHLAANTGVGPSVENPRGDMLANVLGTFNCLESARKNKVKRFIFASSGAPVGECEPPIHEELPAHPVSPYGASKLSGEAYCSAYFRTFNLETIALRFGNVYGPGSTHKASVVAKFIKLAIQQQPLEIYGDGSQTRDFIYIEDLINAINLAAKSKNVGGETFQIASNRETSISELMSVLLPTLEKFSINDVRVNYSDKRKGDVMYNYSDTSKAREILGWESKTSLSEGLCATIDYFLRLCSLESAYA